MALLEDPPLFWLWYLLALFVCGSIGTVCSVPKVWARMFPRNVKDNAAIEKRERSPEGRIKPPLSANYTTYLKSGEYGESEHYPFAWSPFVEPLNAWTSLTYSLFGVVIFCTGMYDYYTADNTSAVNIIAANPGFSIVYGVSTVYLGVASFLFHASHSETWRKADAGMTSGCIVTPLVLALYDRARPPFLGPWSMVCLAALLQTSLTHGYLPYGSSDVLLPSLVALCWVLELSPRYGGAVDEGQLHLWWRCFFTCIGGMLLRLSDIKRGNPPFFSWAMRIFAFVVIFPFGFYLGYNDPVILCGVAAGVVVYLNPSKGHIFWHFGSAFSLYMWWYQYRVRPGDPLEFRSNDATFLALVFCVAIKNALRRLVMMVPYGSQELRDRVFFLAEHTFFALWCYNVVVTEPEANKQGSSWLLNVRGCWTDEADSEAFRLFYLARSGTAVEDVLFMLITKVFASSSSSSGSATSSAPTSSSSGDVVKSEGDDDKPEESGGGTVSNQHAEKDVKMLIHHAATATLCLLSAFSGYTRIGSLVMLLHDTR